jgi:hypothetical protein
MKKYLILPAFIILVQTALFAANVTTKTDHRLSLTAQDSLIEYTGKYQMVQGMQYMEVYVENGKLTGKDLQNGTVKVIDHVSGDNFILSQEKIPVKFIRDKENKVSQIAVMGNVIWTKINDNKQTSASVQPVNLTDYLGKYQASMNGQNAIIEISLKGGQLLATQLWDGGNSALQYKSDDEFTVIALSWPIRFIRDKGKKITQLLLNGTDTFIKVKN